MSINSKNKMCIFCNVIKGELTSNIVFENDDVIVILDLFPFSKGHCLVISKKHFENILEFKDEKQLFANIKAVRKTALLINKAFNPTGIKIVNNTGKPAGQVIFHYHVHVIPFYQEGQLKLTTKRENTQKTPKNDFLQVLSNLKKHLV